MTEKRNQDKEHYFVATPKSEVKFGMIYTKLRGETVKFLTASSIFSKKQIDLGTRLLIETMQLPERGAVLDIGCGYGPVGMIVALLKPRLSVIMTDVNKRAVQLARRNLKINKVHNAKVRLGYLYESIKDLEFNCVLSNPPVSAGMGTVKAIITHAPKVMTNESTFQIVIRSKIGAKTLPTVFQETFGNCRVLARKSGYRVLMGKRR
jgi:16S rRNA (guanine1207-N2)-methyltransferase